MKIAFVTNCFSPEMGGYAAVALPRALAKIPGNEVTVIAANLNVYFFLENYEEIYGRFLGGRTRRIGEEVREGYTLRYVPHVLYAHNQVDIPKLGWYLQSLRPDVVHTWMPAGPIGIRLAWQQPRLRFRLFTAQHTTKSVFKYAQMQTLGPVNRLKVFLTRQLMGWYVHRRAIACFAATKDCGDIAVRFMGVPLGKCLIREIGVSTDVFFPPSTESETEERVKGRREMGVSESEVVCLYTGRFSEDKNPVCLSEAVAKLRGEGLNYRAVFVGEGPQLDRIRKHVHNVVMPFKRHEALARLYRTADIAVWPTQESISMLDAAASGLPIIVSDRIVARERVNGNGLTYRQGSVESLCEALRILGDPNMRRRLGEAGREKMVRHFSWDAVAAKTQECFAGARLMPAVKG